jgi:RNA polymerase sigma-70 factor (ECF subfamily)
MKNYWHWLKGRPEGRGPRIQSAPGKDAGLLHAREEADLIARLQHGEQAAFEVLIERYHASLLRLALLYVPDHAVAEEVVQETWLAVLQGIARFEGRSSLKTWLFSVLVNSAKARARHEGRTIPFSALPMAEGDREEAEPDADRFFPADHPTSPGKWAWPPASWAGLPEERLLSQETRRYLQQALQTLSSAQRWVIVLRDVEGWTAQEVCHILGLTETNQRVLLHRARARVRRQLEQYFQEE